MIVNKNKVLIIRSLYNMSYRMRFVLFLFLFLFINPFSSVAQDRKELEKQRIKLQKEIKEINSLLFESQTEEKNLLSELSGLNRRIRVRARLINTINEETEKITLEIGKNNKEVELLQKSLKELKKNYANMVVQSYKNKAQQSRLMFILSSDNFLQAYKRLEYINQYARYRVEQGKEIIGETEKIEKLNNYLAETKEIKERLLLTKKKEKRKIDKEKVSQESLVKSVKKKENKYISQIKKKQKKEKAIDRKITKLIRDAIAESNKKTNTKGSSFVLTPEAIKLEKDFVSNKGKLPSPVERGIIVRHFGKQSHPSLKGITIESNGVFYATEKNANARVIFNGKVMAIQVMPGKKKAVLIQHGNYISVYKNLENVTVKAGDLVSTKQKLGKIHTDKTTGKTILAFVLFKEIHRQNPEEWVYKN
ncbi:MAG: peptidoglycan DD-metalloendopeptidase family protein [Flavobacteriaceae bacterium]|nr:peptidoglycan DD-metalloendopeptidase family protein [Flavobacteriaceae bacterium]